MTLCLQVTGLAHMSSADMQADSSMVSATLASHASLDCAGEPALLELLEEARAAELEALLEQQQQQSQVYLKCAHCQLLTT